MGDLHAGAARGSDGRGRCARWPDKRRVEVERGHVPCPHVCLLDNTGRVCWSPLGSQMTNAEALIPFGHFVKGTSCIAGTIFSGACNKTKNHPCQLGRSSGTFLDTVIMCRFDWRVLSTHLELVPTKFFENSWIS